MAKFPTTATGDAQTVDTDDTSRALAALAARAAAQMAGENFPVALRLLPRLVAADLAAVYRYARFVDDVGDEPGVGPATRLARLDAVERDVHALAGGLPALGPVAGLVGLMIRRGVPLAPLLELIEANRIDQRVSSYENFADLLGYCRYSAAPVGRLVLHRAEAATATNIAESDEVCAALQVLEHCQDVGEDARAGRVYLPGVELRRAGVDPAELSGSLTSPALRRVIAVQVARSRELLRPGRSLVRRLPGWSRVAVAGYVAGGLATADALQRADFAVLENPLRPSKARTLARALRLLGHR